WRQRFSSAAAGSPEKKTRAGAGICFFKCEHPLTMSRQIRLSGRELGVMRTIGFGLGMKGTEIQERTQIEPEDLCDLLNTLLDVGYLETLSMKERVPFLD